MEGDEFTLRAGKGFLKLRFNKLLMFSAIFKYVSSKIKVRNVLKCSDLRKSTLTIYILSTKCKYMKPSNTFSGLTHSVRKNRGPLTTEDYTCVNCYSSQRLCISACNKVNTPSNRFVSYRMNLSSSTS